MKGDFFRIQSKKVKKRLNLTQLTSSCKLNRVEKGIFCASDQ